MCALRLAGHTVVVPKGQATPDHTISIMSSGDRKPRASASGDRTAAVASAAEVGRLFLRDICVPGSTHGGRELNVARHRARYPALDPPERAIHAHESPERAVLPG